LNILSIDTGSICGWAIFSKGSYDYGVRRFPGTAIRKNKREENRMYNGERFFTFSQFLKKTIQEYDIDHIVCEHNNMGDSSHDNLMLLGGWLSLIQTVVFSENVLRSRRNTDLISGPYEFTTSQWRKGFYGRYPKLPQEWSQEKKREEHKRRAIQACQDAGFDIEDDNVADAMLMLIAFRKSVDPAYSAAMGTPVQEKLELA